MHKLIRCTETEVWPAHGYLMRTGSKKMCVYTLKFIPSGRMAEHFLLFIFFNLFLHKWKILRSGEIRENNSWFTRASKEREDLSLSSFHEDEREHPFSLSFSPAGLSMGHLSLGISENTSGNSFHQVWKRK